MKEDHRETVDERVEKLEKFVVRLYNSNLVLTNALMEMEARMNAKPKTYKNRLLRWW